MVCIADPVLQSNASCKASIVVQDLDGPTRVLPQPVEANLEHLRTLLAIAPREASFFLIPLVTDQNPLGLLLLALLLRLGERLPVIIQAVTEGTLDLLEDHGVVLLRPGDITLRSP